MKRPGSAFSLSNPPGYSMMYPPATVLPGTSQALAFPGPASVSSPSQIPLSVPPPSVNNQQQPVAGGRPSLHIAFSGPPPPFATPPPPLNTTQSALSMSALHSFPGIPVPPLYHLPPPPLYQPGVRPGYPPPPIPPNLCPPSQQQRVSAPVSRPPHVHTSQGPAESSLDQSVSRAGTTIQPQEPAGQSNISVKNSQTSPGQATRPSHAAATNCKSSPTTVSPLNPRGDGSLGTPETEVRDNEDKKRRRRRRRRGRAQAPGGSDITLRDGSPGLEHAISSSNVSESTLHFEDVDEFPDLVGGGRGYLPGDECGGADRATLSGTSLSYSDVIKATWSKAGSQSRTQSLTGSCVSGDDEDNTSNHTGTSNLSKRARKRRRRREQANKAAEVELAEISLEQQWLQQVGLRKSPTNAPPRGGGGLITNPAAVGEAKGQTVKAGAAAAGGKKFHQPIAFDIAAMIDAIQKKPAPQPVQASGARSAVGGASGRSARKDVKEGIGNLLDSTAPPQKRGKEREVPRAKKPSPLKKVILKEREQRKRLRLLDGDPDSASSIAG
ncbi:selenocysteine insertion sequence-binding protein 2, partial [Elysia marginata]